MTHMRSAAVHFSDHIQRNPYPGRGLVVGQAEDGSFLLVYWIMGRSDHSRNRRFTAHGTTLRTEPVDPGRVEDPSLIIYEAMLELPAVQLVGNGDQVRTLYNFVNQGDSVEQALGTREREPDAPNYTPRISGMLDFRGERPELLLSVLKASVFDPRQTDRFTYRPALPPPGYGLGLTTYMKDGDPLPSFTGDPLVLPCAGRAADVRDRYFEALDANNRVAVAVKHVSPNGQCEALLVRNRYP